MPLAVALSPPSAPTAPSATQGASPGVIELAWGAPTSPGASPVAGYRIYRSLTPTGLSHLADVGNVLTYTDATLSDGAPRYYRFSAVNGDGEGPLSATVTASAQWMPSVPRDLAAQANGRGNLTLTWKAPLYDGSNAITSYNLYRGPTSTGPFTLLASPTLRIHNDTGNPDNTTYWYQVSAVNAIGEGPLSVPQPHRTPTRPGIPANFTGGFFPGFGITLNWEPPYDTGGMPLTGYVVYRIVGTQPENVWGTAGPGSVGVTDRDCPLLQTCSYRIIAHNRIGRSDYTHRVNGTGDSLPIVD